MTDIPDEDLIERLRAIARQRHEQPLGPYRVPVEKLSEWIAADRIASLLQEAADSKRILSDPVAVHLNMLSGRIARISMENCAHSHGIQFNDLEAAEAALASRLEQNETLTGQLAAAMEEIASLKQSLAEAEGQIQHLEQCLSEAAEIIHPFAHEAEHWESSTFPDSHIPVCDVEGRACAECGDDPDYASAMFTLGDLRRARGFLATMGERHD
jgi:hypothetical protein